MEHIVQFGVSIDDSAIQRRVEDSCVEAVKKNELCLKFNVAASELVPRLQAYGMAMSLYGVVAGLIFVIAIIIAAVFLIKKYDDEGLAVASIAVLLEIIPVIVVFINTYAYIGWKYAPEVKSIEYIMQLFKN